MTERLVWILAGAALFLACAAAHTKRYIPEDAFLLPNGDFDFETRARFQNGYDRNQRQVEADDEKKIPDTKDAGVDEPNNNSADDTMVSPVPIDAPADRPEVDADDEDDDDEKKEDHTNHGDKGSKPEDSHKEDDDDSCSECKKHKKDSSSSSSSSSSSESSSESRSKSKKCKKSKSRSDSNSSSDSCSCSECRECKEAAEKDPPAKP